MLTKQNAKQYTAAQIIAYANANCSAQVAANTAVYQANKPAKQAPKSVFIEYAKKPAKAPVTLVQRFKDALERKRKMLFELAQQYARFGDMISIKAKFHKLQGISDLLFNYSKRQQLPEYMSNFELRLSVMSTKLVAA